MVIMSENLQMKLFFSNVHPISARYRRGWEREVAFESESTLGGKFPLQTSTLTGRNWCSNVEKIP